MAYDNKKEFASGLYINSTPLTSNIETSKENFVFFRIGINKRELMDYLENKPANDKGFINLDVKQSADKTKFYAEVNNYKPREDNPIEQNRSGDNTPTSSSKYLKDFEAKKKREQKEQWEQSKEDKFDEPPF
tara:strand:+ start:1187 stop:1582 length:396 start_codon:yes stop_codon:yes gene_type:complete